jgi:hypothetical protein
VTPEQRRYLFVQSVIGSAIVNGFINGVLGWAGTAGLAQFPMWKTPGVAADLVATAFGVTFGTTLGMRLQARLDTTRGKITPPSPSTVPAGLWALVSRMPKGLWARAVVLGLVALPLFAPPVLVLATRLAAGDGALPRNVFVSIKTVFSAVEGSIVTPVLLLAALLDRLDARTSS